jgi:hypothetical protein
LVVEISMRRLLKKSELQKTDFTKTAQSYELDCKKGEHRRVTVSGREIRYHL